MRRFERIYDVVEPVEEYRPGGYHPVQLKDVLHSRYEVIGKLAFGQSSTVWAAKDRKIQRQVALKILKADASSENRELGILLNLASCDLDHPGRAHVIELLDHFYHQGPNGTHLCLVLPVMVSDGSSMTVSGKPHSSGYVRTICRQLLLGTIDFLHHLGIVHCDLKPANIMFSVSTNDEGFLQPPEFCPVQWLEGVARDDSAPRYLMPTQRPRGYLDNACFSTLTLKIGDFGAAQWAQQCNQRPATPTALRAPEIINQEKWDMNIDIWTLGCSIFELATNEPLFPLDTFGLTEAEVDQDHRSLITQRFCPISQKDGDFPEYLQNRLHNTFGAKNKQGFASFLLFMLQLNPQCRLSAKRLLTDLFLLDDFQG
ncbi:hypothetical protein ASPZODRAFT_132656 [Penicilliopsis zonata CBS 506.65]|uniref:non-specific serine/threonine protein kinase n=1 Tax=Penicilliopsis zonata CBS 506.65 TaxID=1073090 RepID=A0A1L9SHL2_9EURO|nr:hypothetical protein ASPZODRAFT_132656 [Penicilliopsis zonata CBS 506.65]OJJ46586.1 hypothetical protein ASPZODRAFT_132656 [Penicilliopsis zonata CBS 506.65]